MSERNFAPIHEVTMYQARCTSCGTIEDDYGDYSAWGDKSTPVEDVVCNRDCLNCQKCEVCGADNAHGVTILSFNGDDDEHLVCGDHEDYDFETVT